MSGFCKRHDEGACRPRSRGAALWHQPDLAWFARLDFIFTDVSDSAVSRCETLDDRYGSDHRPIVLTINYPAG